MSDEFSTVYGWVLRTRGGLLSFLARLPWDALTRTFPDVGHGSVRGLLLHIGGCYRWWLEYFAGGKPPLHRQEQDLADMAAVRTEFAAVDGIVETFITARSASPDAPFTLPMPHDRKAFTASPRWLFTHTTTHEFHHKGQIVMLCRRLGHPPAETDLWEPSWKSG